MKAWSSSRAALEIPLLIPGKNLLGVFLHFSFGPVSFAAVRSIQDLLGRSKLIVMTKASKLLIGLKFLRSGPKHQATNIGLSRHPIFYGFDLGGGRDGSILECPSLLRSVTVREREIEEERKEHRKKRKGKGKLHFREI
ncbi:hypothetical protein Tco_0397803 [Tanacetum coccineum]